MTTVSTDVSPLKPHPVATTGLPAMLVNMGKPKLIRLGLGLILMVSLLFWMLLASRQPDWKVLFANLADKDGGAIVAQLSQMNVPYKHAEGGGAILVPADRVHETRLRLASMGLPKGSTGGFDLVESNRFGMTQFQERLTFQRGLEGELSRSIQALSSVQTARVHLAIPNQNGFFREQQKPSASVLVNLHPGRTLDRVQVAGIVHLVASSVAELSPKSVSIIDGSGNLLSTPADAQGAGADAQQLQYVQQLEQMYTHRVLEILEPVVGRNNVRAQVTAEMDFSQTEMTSEQHKPNQGSEVASIRSQQIVESGGSSTSPAGVPGAASNQPVAAASAPVNAAAAQVSVSSSGTAASGKRESVTNYEVDKTTRVVRGSSGVIRRLTTAVVVNHRQQVDAAGKTTSAALTPEQLERITAVIKETVGFSKDRGDSVQVMNTPFTTEKIEVLDVPWWKDAEVQDMARTLVWPLALLSAALVVVFAVVRPFIQGFHAEARSREPGLDTLVSELPERAALPAQELVPLLPAGREQPQVHELQDLAMQNPAMVANIVKGWINGQPAH